MRRSLIVGASAGLGRALAEQMAEAGHTLFLVASDGQDLAPLAADLSIRFNAKVTWMATDLARVDAAALRDRVLAALGGLDDLMLVAGFSDLARDRGPVPPAMVERLVAVNLTSALLIANAFLGDLAANPRANLVGMGSVAAVRGRRSNMVYGAAKRGLEGYFESCRHWLAGEGGAKVQFYRLGFLSTSLTFGQRLPFPALSPEKAAHTVIANLGRDLGACYLPWWWRGIMTLLAHMPWGIFRRLDI